MVPGVVITQSIAVDTEVEAGTIINVTLMNQVTDTH